MRTPRELDRRPAALALLAASGLLAGCHGGKGSYVYVQTPQVETIAEQEPNDTFVTPQGIGPVGGGDLLTIFGHSDFFDTDGFAFVAAEDIEVRVTLDGDNPFSDLELCVYDPFLGDFTLCLLSPDSDEFGSFTVSQGFEFHLVVSSAFGGSSYDLDVEVFDFNGFVPFSATEGGEGDGLAPKVVPLDAQPHERGLEFHEPERQQPFLRYLEAAGADADDADEANQASLDPRMLASAAALRILGPGLPVLPANPAPAL